MIERCDGENKNTEDVNEPWYRMRSLCNCRIMFTCSKKDIYSDPFDSLES